MPTKEKAGSKPPNHEITNKFAINHIQLFYSLMEKNKPSQMGLENKHLSDIICAAIACQNPYSFIFDLMGVAYQPVVEIFSSFWMDQSMLMVWSITIDQLVQVII